jgi:hypothetical protein
MIKSFILRPRAETRRDQVARTIIDYPFNSSNFYLSARDIARDRAVAKFSIAHAGCTEKDVWDINLDERDPEKARFLWNTPYTRHPRALEAVNSPLFAPRFAAFEMQLNGQKVTRASLARALGVCVSTLYRRYGQREIWKVCQEQPLRVLASVGKKTPFRARSELD